MESVLSILFNAENVRMLVVLVFGYSGYVLINSKMGRLESSLNKKIDDLKHNELAAISKRIDGVETSLSKRIDEVEFSLNKRIDGVEASLSKRIDEVEFSLNKRIDGVEASIGDAIEALTYALEKNGSLAREDKEYVDRRLTN
jgi:hypothetical protein